MNRKKRANSNEAMQHNLHQFPTLEIPSASPSTTAFAIASKEALPPKTPVLATDVAINTLAQRSVSTKKRRNFAALTRDYRTSEFIR